LAVLAGGQPEACWAKYGGINIPNAPFTHELALRILLGTIQSSAARYRRSIEPMMSCSIDYYVRIFVVVRNDATVVKQASSKTSLLYYCQSCKSFETQPIGKFIRTEKGSKYGPCAVNISPDCMQCGSKYHIGGPFYSDPLHNKEFVCRMLGHVAHNHALFGTWERMVGMLVMIYEERDDPLYYVLPRMCGILHCSNPPFAKFVSGLLSTGYKVSQSHAYQQAIKTNAPPQVVWDILRQWCKLEPPSSKNISQTSPAYKILAVEPRFILH
jgi:tRNA (guanine26-N2/guanine27-N2)-dimethyltransferase